MKIRNVAIYSVTVFCSVAAVSCHWKNESKKAAREDGETGRDGKAREAGGEPRVVRTVSPQRKDLERSMDLPGTIAAYYQATLLAQVAGYVKTVRFDKGDLVREGDLIAEIEVPELRAERIMREAQVEQAEAALERALVLVETARAQTDQARAALAHADALARLQTKIHERAKALRADGDISQQDLEVASGQREAADAERTLAEAKVAAARAEEKRAETDVSVAHANLSAAKAALAQTDALLSYAYVRAPFDGVVTARFLDPGALVQRATRSESAQPVVTVATRGRVRLDFEAPESEVAFIHSGSRIEVKSDAYGSRRFEGTVTRVASALRPETRTMLCEAELPNDDDALLPGMYVTVRVVLERHPGALIVPPEAIVERGPETFAFTVERGLARRKPVTRGWDFGTFVEVREGLSPGDEVVLGASDIEDEEHVEGTLSGWSPEAEEQKKAQQGAEGKRGEGSP